MSNEEEARPVLAEVTNRPLKRGFSLMSSGKFVLKSSDLLRPSPSPSPTQQQQQKQQQQQQGHSNFSKQLFNNNTSTLPINQTVAIDVSITPPVSTGGAGGPATTNVDYDDDDDASVTEHGSIESLRLPDLKSFRSFEFQKCSAPNFDACSNATNAADLLKACSCSFCLTAAYIWSDLHYQDIKGRIAALKKSQKEACFLAQKNGKGEEGQAIDIHAPPNSTRLASDLKGQWKSLFLQMEDTFARESVQLQAKFAALKDLRENCKMDLERSTDGPFSALSFSLMLQNIWMDTKLLSSLAIVLQRIVGAVYSQ
ncbi:hypothetical protein ACFE04_017464 [Oxalis oulophora]